MIGIGSQRGRTLGVYFSILMRHVDGWMCDGHEEGRGTCRNKVFNQTAKLYR